MSLPNEKSLHKLQFYVTTPYKCGYLPNKMAQSLIASPQHLIDAKVYSGLMTQGFRRSGKFAYRPYCENCSACIAVRLVLDIFTPTRSQKRAFKQHGDLTAQIMPLHYSREHFALYDDYQSLRHADDTTAEAEDNAAQYHQFLCQSNVESLMIVFRDVNEQVKIVSVVDIVQDGVSAVYTFYDARQTKASFGTFAIMWLAEWAKSLNLNYLYLGYWIQDSQKMAYKQAFNPQERLINGEWLRQD